MPLEHAEAILNVHVGGLHSINTLATATKEATKVGIMAKSCRCRRFLVVKVMFASKKNIFVSST